MLVPSDHACVSTQCRRHIRGTFAFILFLTCYVSAVSGSSDWHLCLNKCYFLSSKVNITYKDQVAYCQTMGASSKPVDFGSKLEQSLATELNTCQLVKTDNEPYWINKQDIGNSSGTPSCRTITFSGINIRLDQSASCSSLSHPFCEEEKSFCQSSAKSNTITYDWVSVAGQSSFYKLSSITYPFCDAKYYCEEKEHGKISPGGNYSFMGLLATQLGITGQRKLDMWLDSPGISCPSGQGEGTIMRFAGPVVHVAENRSAAVDFSVLCESNTTNTTTTPTQSSSTLQTTIIQRSRKTRSTTFKTSSMSTKSASTNMTTQPPVKPPNLQLNTTQPTTHQPTTTVMSKTHLTPSNTPKPVTTTMSHTNMTSSNTPKPVTPTISHTNMTSSKTPNPVTPIMSHKNMTSSNTANPTTPTMTQTNMTSTRTPSPTTSKMSQSSMTSLNTQKPASPTMSLINRKSSSTQNPATSTISQRNTTQSNTLKPATPTMSQTNMTSSNTPKPTTPAMSQTNMTSSKTLNQTTPTVSQTYITSIHSSTADPSTRKSVTSSTKSSLKPTSGPGWTKIGQEEYFVNYKPMSYSKAERFCHDAMNASLVMFLNPIRYFTILTEIALRNNSFWVGAHGLDKEMLSDECLSYIAISVTMTTLPCHYEKFSVCSRLVDGDVSQFLEDPEFKKLIREMTVLKNETGKRIRKQTCATDRRPSARAAGGVGVFDPGCSFSNGQCIYNVKLGHESHCDAAGKRATSDGSSTTTSGFQACSCKDVESLKSNMNSLWSTMTTLQQNFNSLAGQLNVTQQKLGMKESEVASLLADNHNISAQLANHQILMNKSQVELANTVASLNKELDRVRRELRNTNDQLTTCKVSLNVGDGQKTNKPVLYGNFVTHYCGFEDGNNCNYTLGTCKQSNEDCWYKGSGRQDVYSGPIEDHTFGAPNGHYMFIDPSKKPAYTSSSSSTSAHPYRYARITSPTLPPAHQYCVRFWYTMHGRDIGRLRVYAQVGGGDGYPVYEKSGNEDQYWHMAQISLDSEYTAQPFKIVIEGNTNSYYVYSFNAKHTNHNTQGYIAFDDVYIYNTSCSDVPSCPAGSRKMTVDNVTSCYTYHVSPKTWSEAVEACKSEAPNAHLVSVNSKKEQDFLVDTIQSDAVYMSVGSSGWYTSGTDERNEGHFVWTETGYPYQVNYTDWHIGQPNNVGNVQNCLLLQYSDVKYEWGDVNCKDKHPFICEMHV